MTEPSSITYRVRGAGREYGPVDFATLERWVREARVTRNTAVWSSSDGQWRAARERRELDAAFAAWIEADAPPVVGPPVNAQAIWSFVPAVLFVPKGVILHNGDLCSSFAPLSARIAEKRKAVLAMATVLQPGYREE